MKAEAARLAALDCSQETPKKQSPEETIEREDLLEMQNFRSQVTDHVPPVAEIAMIAATLVAGRDVKPQNLLFVANQAIALWQECAKARELEVDRLALYARASTIGEAKSALLRPKKFPVALDEFLKCMMPRKRPEDRAKFHREYVRQHFPEKSPSEDEVAKVVEQEKGEKISENLFYYRAADFRQWLKGYESANRRKRAQAGAEALKRKRQKIARTQDNEDFR